MRESLQRNLTLRTDRAGNQIIQADIQFERSAFDPSLALGPTGAYGWQTFVLPATEKPPSDGGPVSGTQSVPAMTAGISGTLPISTRYTASFDTTLTRQNPSLTQLLPNEVGSTLALSVDQPLLNGRGRSIAEAGVESARLSASASSERLERSVEVTVADTETAYWSLGLVIAQEDEARNTLARTQALLQRNQQMLELELIAEVDLVTARQAVASRQTLLTQAIKNRKDAEEALVFLVFGEEAANQLRGRMVDLLTEDPPSQAPDLPPVERAVDRALTERNDVRAAEYDLDVGEVSRRLADNDLLPELDLTATFTALTASSPRIRLFNAVRANDLELSSWQVGVSFTYPLGNNAAKASLAQAGLTVNQLQLDLASSENLVRSQVREAERAVRADAEKLQYATQSYDLSQLPVPLLD